MEPALIDRTIQKTNIWLEQMTGGDTIQDRNQAYHALRAVLQHLRDRLTVSQAAHLGDQLPTMIRGIYYEAWKPAFTPTSDKSFPEFVESCKPTLEGHPEIDVEEAVAKTFQVLKANMDRNELRRVFSQLPEDMQEILLA